MESAPGVCAVCGEPLPPRQQVGRPKEYCSATCRSAARRTRERHEQLAAARSARRCSVSIAGHFCEQPAVYVIVVDGREMRTCGVCRELAISFLTNQASAAATVDTRRLTPPETNQVATSRPRTEDEPGRVLVVEDDENLRIALMGTLGCDGYYVSGAGSIAEMIAAMEAERPKLILLDRMLPDGDSIKFVRTLRFNGDRIPVVVVTALDSLSDRVAGFDHGVDDYIVKPFHIEELRARVHRAISRSENGNVKRTYFDGLVGMNFETRELRIYGVVVTLSTLEFRFFEILVRHAGAIQSRERIVSWVWPGQPEVATTNMVDVVCSRLRRKLQNSPAGEQAVIISVRGCGYLYQPPIPAAGKGTQPSQKRAGYGHAGQVLDKLNAQDRQREP